MPERIVLRLVNGAGGFRNAKTGEEATKHA